MRRNRLCLLVFCHPCKKTRIEYFRWLLFYECLISKIDKCLKSNILLRPGSKRLQYFEGGGVLSLVRVSVSRKVWVGIRCPIELISWSKRERKITNLCSPKKRGTRGFMFVTFTSTTRLTSKSENTFQTYCHVDSVSSSHSKASLKWTLRSGYMLYRLSSGCEDSRLLLTMLYRRLYNRPRIHRVFTDLTRHLMMRK